MKYVVNYNEWSEEAQEKLNVPNESVTISRIEELIDRGFKVMRLWEHEIRKMTLEDFKQKIENYGKEFAELKRMEELVNGGN